MKRNRIDRLMSRVHFNEDPAAPPTDGGDAPPADPPVVANRFMGDALGADWQKEFAVAAGFEGEDADKYVKRLSRFSDVGALTRSLIEAQDKIRSGEVSTGLPDDPTDEQLAAYREANDIPATAEGYNLSLDEGLVLGEEDQPIMAEVFKAAHASNVPASALSGMVNAMLQGRANEIAAQDTKDAQDQSDAIRALTAAWGIAGLKTNQAVINNWLKGMPEDVSEQFANARMADGTALMNNPKFLVWAAEQARSINPVLPEMASSDNPVAATNDRIAQLERMMGSKEWFDSPNLQAEYMRLIDSKNAMKDK